jgi:hypothetical protein
MRNFKYFLLMIFTLLLYSSCESDTAQEGKCQNKVEIKNPTGKLHGIACEKDEDCKYGRCYESPVTTKSTFKFCTKDCSCGDLSPCILDNTETMIYLCQRGPFDNDTIVNFCTPKCTSIDDCTKIDPCYNACEILTGTYKTCLLK